MSAERDADGRLFDLYRQYIGEPDSERDVYVGFGLFLSGVVIAFVALVLFLYASSFGRSDAYFAWARPAYALGMLSLPAMMLGTVVLLPAERKVLAVSAAGAAVTAVATAGFVAVYPESWNFMAETDYTVEVTATYALGLAGITASTGAALIAHYLEMARSVEAVTTEDAGDEDEPSYTDEEIARDIDEAMEDVEFSWGGVERTEHSRLEFTDDAFEGAEMGPVGLTETRSSGVDEQVSGLKGLKGGETKTATSNETVDDQTQKLQELRAEQRAEELATADEGEGALAGPASRLSAVVDGLRRRLRSTFGTE